MLTDEVIDEDIETLLYAQVYYGQSDIADLPNAQESNVSLIKEGTVEIAIETNVTSEEHCQNPNLNIEESQSEKEKNSSNKTDLSINSIDNSNLAAISQDQALSEPSSPQYIELSTFSASTSPIEIGSQITTQIPIEKVSTNASSPLLDNIKINQHIHLEEQFLNRLKVYKESIWSSQCEKNLKRFQKGKLNEKEFFDILKKRKRRQQKKLKKQEQIRKVFFTRQRELALSEIICLSDSDNSDLEIVGVDIVSPTKNPKVVKRNIIMSTVGASNDEDDEIIYVPPPPVPVIDVDEESGSDEESDASQEVLEKSQDQNDASNDFLAPTNTSENFNFSLHGSEFQDAEFVRPANPTDTYETESSTSTSDFNRESSREFNNSVKTIVFNEVDFPREDIFEGNNLEKFGELITPNKEIEDGEAETKEHDNVTSRESTRAKPRTLSESSSECDYLEVHSNLPDLSPMVCVDSPRKGQSNHSKVLDELQKNTKTTNFAEGYDGIIDIDDQDSSPKKRLKRRSSMLIDDCSKKKSKKNKKKVYKAFSDNLEKSENEMNSFIFDRTRVESQEFAKKKGKKKKKQSKSFCEIVLEEDKEDTNKRSKKQKGVSKLLTEDFILEDIGDDRSTKKTRKRKQKQASTEDAANMSCSSENQVISDDNPESRLAQNMEESQMAIVEDQDQDREIQENIDSVKQAIKGAEPAEATEKVLVETQEEADVILIEKDIPVHTIESSDSDNDDIQTFDDVGDELELANINEDIEKVESKELEEFDVDYMKSKMSDDPEKWKILPSDRFNLNIAKRGPRCRKCRQYGHMLNHCPNKPAIPSCTMCGYEGHQEPRCPNRVCFTCGQPSKYSTMFCHRCANQKNRACHLCRLPGHSANYCPDLWRRYYLTTKEGPLVKPKRNSMNLKPRNKLWCSGCAGKGHLEFECNSYKWIREYPTSSPRVFKFKDVYESEKKDGARKISDHCQNRNNSPKEQTHIRTEQVVLESLDRSTEKETATTRSLPSYSPEPIHPAGTSQDLQPRSKELLSCPVKPFRSPPRNLHGFRSEKPNVRARLNPFSVYKKPTEPTGYTPYQSMFNPCSVLGVNALNNATNNVSSLMGSATLGLFNALSNLVNGNIGQQDGEFSFVQQPQYNTQLPYSNNYTDFPQPWQNSNSSNRDYLDVPYTITREPSRGSDSDTRNFQYNQMLSVTDGPRAKNHLPESSSNTQAGFLSLTVEPLGIEEPVRSHMLNNVEEITAKKFIHSSIEDLNAFLSSELDKLDNIKSSDAKIYKKKLNNIDQLRKIDLKTNSVKKQIYFHYKHINMFLFGIQKLADGKKNIDLLRNFVYQPGRHLYDGKRNTLLAAYGYIFGGEHPNFNYRKHLNALSIGHRRNERSRS